MGRIMRKLVFAAFVTGAVLVGLVTQAGVYLLALPTPAATASVDDNGVAPFAMRGPHAVGMRRLAVDEAPIAITVWYPAVEPPTGEVTPSYAYAVNMLGAESATALATYKGYAHPGAAADLSAGPYPLVVLSHGFAITSSSYAWLAEHLASYGFVVAAPQHDETLDPGALWKSTVERPQDVLAALAFIDDEVGDGGEFEALINTETVAVVGHSYGGYTALAAAGARVNTGAFEATCAMASQTEDPLAFLCDALLPRQDDMADLAGLATIPGGLWPASADGRVDAVVSLAGDAAVFGESGLAEITVPLLAIGGTADTDSPFEWGTQFAYDNVSSAHKIEIGLEDAEHLIFAGECDEVRRILRVVSIGFCSDPAWDRNDAHGLIAHYTTAFLLAELEQDRDAASALAAGDQRFARVGYRQEGYGSPANAGALRSLDERSIR